MATKIAYQRKHGLPVRSPPEQRRPRNLAPDRSYARSAAAPPSNLAEISEDLYQRVTQYHAQIGSNVGAEDLKRLEAGLVSEGRVLAARHQWDDALDVFLHALAVSERALAATDKPLLERTLSEHAWKYVVDEKRQCQGTAGVLQQIAYCLHCLGELEAAKAYYEQALAAFVRARKRNALIDWWRYGEETETKIQTIRSRLDDIEEGRPPYDLGDAKPFYGSRRAEKGPAASAARLDRLIARHEDRRLGWSADDDPDEAEWADRHADREAADREAELEAERRAAERWRRGGAREADEGYQPNYEEDEEPQASAQDDAALQDDGYGDNEAEREAARREWLNYYLQCREWEEARQLVRTEEEMEDLEYLIGREEREREGEL